MSRAPGQRAGRGGPLAALDHVIVRGIEADSMRRFRSGGGHGTITNS